MYNEDEIKRFQNMLLLIRKSMGWSAEEFGDRIGVSRQTINNLECNPPRSELTKTQYIAMRTILSKEISENDSETKILQDLLDVCIDNPDKYDSRTKDDVEKRARALVPAIVSKDLSRKEANIQWKELFAVAGAFAAGVVVGASFNNTEWLNKLTGQFINQNSYKR